MHAPADAARGRVYVHVATLCELIEVRASQKGKTLVPLTSKVAFPRLNHRRSSDYYFFCPRPLLNSKAEVILSFLTDFAPPVGDVNALY